MRLGAILFLLAALPVLTQQRTVEPDLTKTVVFNRAASVVDEDGRKAVRLDERPGDGVAWLENVQFTNGVIEIDLKGRDVAQRSFLGVAFRGVDDKTYDAVYFRPFNFRTDDPARRIRAVQYISHPAYTWDKLRAAKPGQYEIGIAQPPDPNGWFHARIVIEKPKVSVFVDGAAQPSLTIEELSDRTGGRIGLWVGNGSNGAFSGLKVTARP